jgi:AAA+ superfamily predicted ATPase
MVVLVIVECAHVPFRKERWQILRRQVQAQPIECEFQSHIVAHSCRTGTHRLLYVCQRKVARHQSIVDGRHAFEKAI